MENLLKKISNWNKNRVERNYERIISEYSLEEQELIRKGRDVVLIVGHDKRMFEKITEIVVEYIGGDGNYRSYDHRSALTGRDYKLTVHSWLELGELGADILLKVPPFGIGFSSFSDNTIGVPAKIVGTKGKPTLNSCKDKFRKKLEEKLAEKGLI